MFKIMILWVACSCWASALWAMPGDIEEKTLKNGVRVVVIPEDRAPVAVLEVVYRIGGFAETRPLTGISHVVEHMMFQGTPRHPEDTFSDTLAKMGAVYNAFTADDMTGYYEMAAASNLETLFELEADRAANLSIPKENFLKEIEVVKEERRMRVEDVPQAFAHERFQAAAFPSGPYHDPLVGWMDDLEHMTTADIRAWYDRWYRPENMVVLVAGKVEPKVVFRLAEKYFGHLVNKTKVETHVPAEVEPLGSLRLDLHVATQVPQVMLGYHVPTIVSAAEVWEPYAIAVAMNLLDGGLSARFEKHLVRDQALASSIWSYVDEVARFDTLAIFGGTPATGVAPEALEKAILEELKTLKMEEVSDEELDLAKIRIKAQQTFARDNLMDLTNFYAGFEGVGLTWEDADAYFDHIDAVTPEHIQQVVNKYFVSEREVVTTILPEEQAA